MSTRGESYNFRHNDTRSEIWYPSGCLLQVASETGSRVEQTVIGMKRLLDNSSTQRGKITSICSTLTPITCTNGVTKVFVVCFTVIICACRNSLLTVVLQRFLYDKTPTQTKYFCSVITF